MQKYLQKLLNIGLFLFITCGAVFFYWRTEDVLQYQWQWSRLIDFFWYTDASGEGVPGALLRGLATTIRLSLWSMLVALLFGLFFGVMRTQKRLFARLVSSTYVGLIRNIPPIVLVFIFYFFVTAQIMPALGIESFIRSLSPELQAFYSVLFAAPSSLGVFIAAVLTLGIYEGAYIAEIVRSGIESVPQGQWDAASASGLTPLQRMRFVVFPQAMRHAVPPLAGQFISIIKDSAIVSVISVQELTFQGMELMASTYLTFEIWIAVALLYGLLTGSCSFFAQYIERRLDRTCAYR